MKHTKKLISLLLALVMMCALAAPALATGASNLPTTGSITVKSPVAGTTYTAYKIFDAKYERDKKTGEDNYSYTISDGSPWFTIFQIQENMNGEVSTVEEVKLTFHKETDGDWSVTKDEGFSAAEFANYLKQKISENNNIKGETIGTGDANRTDIKLPVKQLGYYFVTAEDTNKTIALCNLTTTDPNAVIYDKNDVPFTKSDSDVESADVGDTIHYTLTGKVPDTEDWTEYTYKITDTMTEGLTYVDDSMHVVIKASNNNTLVLIGNDAAQDAAQYYELKGPIKGSDDKTTFELSIHVIDLNELAYKDATITITYDATINESAVAKISTNTAQLEYGHDNNITSIPIEEKVYTSKIVIDKYEENEPGEKLEDAKFILYKKDSQGTEKYYKFNQETGKVEWVDSVDQVIPEATKEDGSASFAGIANGDYFLKEIAAPTGYNKLDHDLSVTVSGGSTEAELTVTVQVENRKGGLLPSTGGAGTTLFYIIGGALAVGALVLLVTKRRMDSEED